MIGIGNLFFSIQPIFLTIAILFTYEIATVLPWNSKNNNRLILDGYYKEEKSEDENRIRGYLDFYKYYYNDENDSEFENSKEYHKVEKDFETAKNYIKSTNDFIKSTQRENLDFFNININDVSDDDYFYIYEKNKASDMKTALTYYLYYYDIERHILYVAEIVD